MDEIKRKFKIWWQSSAAQVAKNRWPNPLFRDGFAVVVVRKKN